MRKYFHIIAFLFFTGVTFAQNTTLKNGDKAPPLVLLNNQGILQSINFPKDNKVVLVHFWSSSVNKSKAFLARASDLLDRYSQTAYRNAEGFEVITVAVQSDKTAWQRDLKELGLDKMINTIAPKGYNDMYIKGYKVSQLPVPLLIDENGTIILVNPTQLQIEEILDGKKNSPVNTKNLKGKLLPAENSVEGVKGQKLVIANKFGDTLSRTVTDNNGLFTFTEVKFLNEYILKIDTTGPLSGAQKAVIALPSGMFLANVSRQSGQFQYGLNVAEITKLTGAGTTTSPSNKNGISFFANISFKKGTSQLEANSFAELDKVAALLAKTKEYQLEIISHTDSNGDDAENMELSKKRSSAVKTYLVTKDISPARIKPIGKGETEIKNKCKNKIPCTDEEHAENIRTELKFYK